MLDAHAHLCLLASEAEKVNLGFCDGVAEQFYIAIAMSESGQFSCKPMKGRQLIGEFQRGGAGSPDPPPPPPPPEKSTKIGFLSILVRFPLKSQSYQVSIPCWAVTLYRSLMLGYQSAIWMVFRWQANDGQLIVVFGSSLPSSTKKNVVKDLPIFMEGKTIHSEIVKLEERHRSIISRYFLFSNSQPPSGSISLS